jgi:prolipoprotein diacylglyceryltransferase
MKKIFEREGESIEKLDSLFIWTVLATFGSRLGHVFLRLGILNHPIETFTNREKMPRFLFVSSQVGLTGFQGLASHGAAISIIAMYYFSKKVLKRPLLWILDRVVIAVASGAIL